jgi:hypothetical protein
LILHLFGTPDKVLNDPVGNAIRIRASHNIFHAPTDQFVFNLRSVHLDQTLDIAVAESLFQHLVQWREQQNLFAAGSGLLGTTGIDDARLQCDSVNDLESWNRFLGLTDTGSIWGEVIYKGGDLLDKARNAPEELTPEDFRLTPDSAGYQAGPDGKDLGADVDLVGPGEAYHRWKKTPEYQEWRKQTLEWMSTASAQQRGSKAVSERETEEDFQAADTDEEPTPDENPAGQPAESDS